MDQDERYLAMADNYAESGLEYCRRGEWVKALDYHQKALAIYKSLNNKNGMASAHGNLGIVYELMGHQTIAIEHWEISLVLFTEIDAKPFIEKVQAWLSEASLLETQSYNN